MNFSIYMVWNDYGFIIFTSNFFCSFFVHLFIQRFKKFIKFKRIVFYQTYGLKRNTMFQVIDHSCMNMNDSLFINLIMAYDDIKPLVAFISQKNSYQSS